MHINVSVAFSEDERPASSSEQIATQVLAALGANPEKDTCAVNMVLITEQGFVGAAPQPAPVPSPDGS